MANELLIRCPICLKKHTVPRNISVNEFILCDGCGRKFEFQHALPDKDNKAESEPTATNTEYTIVEQVGAQFWGFSLLFCLLSISLLGNHTVDMDGPDFLGFYFITFIILWVTSTLVRWLWRDNNAISLVACIVFEGIALYRIFDLWSKDMHDFEIMIFMMIIGGFIFFLRAEHMQNTGNSGSGCSSCSSGCSGGGGCGGCGG